MTTKLRVLTWNVLYRDRPTRIDILCDTIRHVAPDVVMLQETSPEHAERVAARTGLHLAAIPDVPSDLNTNVPALLARNVLRDATCIELSAPIDGHAYYAVTATLEHETKLTQFCSTHLRHTDRAGRMGLDTDYRKAAEGGPAVTDHELLEKLPLDLGPSVVARLGQLEVLHEHLVASAPTASRRILCGDMNFVPDGPEYKALLRKDWSDSWRAAPRLGSGATILDRNPLIADGRAPYRSLQLEAQPGGATHLDYTLDFQFTQGQPAVNAAWTVGDPEDTGAPWPSDHLGIVVDYEL